jgi:hypothetical protein
MRQRTTEEALVDLSSNAVLMQIPQFKSELFQQSVHEIEVVLVRALGLAVCGSLPHYLSDGLK